MTGKYLYLPPRPHQCNPLQGEGGRRVVVRPGARWQCECGKKWIFLPPQPEDGWTPLRWWHRWTRPMKRGETND